MITIPKLAALALGKFLTEETKVGLELHMPAWLNSCRMLPGSRWSVLVTAMRCIMTSSTRYSLRLRDMTS